MHPALDFVNDVAYVAVKVPNENGFEVTAIATSEGNLYDQSSEWPAQKIERGLQTIADDITLEGAGRWLLGSVEALQEGTLVAPAWQDVYEEVYEAFDRFLVLRDKRYLTVLSLFTMMTYFHPLFDSLPLLFLRGPHESGKSRAAQVLEAMAFNGRADGFASEAVIRRMAHQGRYTQIFTECDNLAYVGSGDPLVRLLQSGCYKSEAWASLAESTPNRKGYTPARFFVYCPRVLCATLRPKSAPLLSRCIELDLVKVPGADQKKLARSIANKQTAWAELRDWLYRLTLLKWQDVVQARKHLKTNWKGISGRTFDKWLPLAAMAVLVSQEVLHVVTELAKESLAEQQQNAGDTFEAILFEFARHTVKYGDKLLSESEIWKLFTESYSTETTEQSRPEWARETDTAVDIGYIQKYIRTPRKLMQELKRLDLAPKWPKETNRGNKYPLSQEHIYGVVGAYLGEQEKEKDPFQDNDPFKDEELVTDEDNKAYLDEMFRRGAAEKTLRF